MENTFYKMTDRDITLMIQLRAANDTIFTGRRNSAMRGWRAIRREMGFQGSMLSARQLKKKWDNLKDKYKVLKNPPLGMETTAQPASWRWFHLMDEALSGRLAGTAPIVQLSPLDEDEECGVLPPLTPPSLLSGLAEGDPGALGGDGMLGEVLQLSGIDVCANVEAASKTGSLAEVAAAGRDGGHEGSGEREPAVMKSQPSINDSQTAVLPPDRTADTHKTSSSCGHAAGEDGEVDEELAELQREWQSLEREQAKFDRELIALERDRELLDRDMDTLERDRAALERHREAVERDRASVERDRAAVDRDRVVLDRDRAFLDRDRAFLDRDRAFLDRDRVFLDRDRVFLDRDRAFLDRDRVSLERALEDLEKERALLRTQMDTVDGRQAEMTTEKEVVLQTRFFQSRMAADLDPDQLETRQRLVSLFQRLVEKL
ncbi:uncharacterized protein LOC121938866 [Plectropomus leopardus]|uniref:uncharacterized protein LOC121938866 n=1 Tax=Plectropomus leopardus TaxID=160734 RepID=UPI001C4BC608|nr:uncharacterized protein LOC121938866 [Plectropomus leopardus]